MVSLVRLSGAEAREAASRPAERLASDPRVQLVCLFGSTTDEGRAEVRNVELGVPSASKLASAFFLEEPLVASTPDPPVRG